MILTLVSEAEVINQTVGRVRLIESVSKVRGIGAVKPLADAIRPERQIGSA